MSLYCAYFTISINVCLGLLDFYQKFIYESKLERSSLQNNVNFFPEQKSGGRFFSTATVFWFETLKNQARNGGR